MPPVKDLFVAKLGSGNTSRTSLMHCMSTELVFVAMVGSKNTFRTCKTALKHSMPTELVFAATLGSKNISSRTSLEYCVSTEQYSYLEHV